MRGIILLKSLLFDLQIERTTKQNSKITREKQQEERALEQVEISMGDENPYAPHTLGDYAIPIVDDSATSIVRSPVILAIT